MFIMVDINIVNVLKSYKISSKISRNITFIFIIAISFQIYFHLYYVVEIVRKAEVRSSNINMISSYHHYHLHCSSIFIILMNIMNMLLLYKNNYINQHYQHCSVKGRSWILVFFIIYIHYVHTND